MTARQRRFWGLRRKGLREAEASRRMGVSRQTANKTYNAIDRKISKALMEAAEVNRIEVRRMDLLNGFLLGHSPSLGMDAFITFSEGNGIQVWYRGEGRCEECSWRNSCTEKLLAEAEERSIDLPEDADSMEPTEISEILFRNIIGE